MIDRLLDVCGEAAEEIDRGSTTFAMRRERIAKLINDFNLAGLNAGGERKGKPETWASVYLRFYGSTIPDEKEKSDV